MQCGGKLKYVFENYEAPALYQPLDQTWVYGCRAYLRRSDDCGERAAQAEQMAASASAHLSLSKDPPEKIQCILVCQYLKYTDVS